MEEAEAVCDRVAIMVSGQLRFELTSFFLSLMRHSEWKIYLKNIQLIFSLFFSIRCIGSIQHLKGKYGRGYSLEVKLREELTGLQQVALLHKEILRIFPHAARQER